MKKLLLLAIALITLNSCSSDSGDLTPKLSFTIESESTIASSEINITNTTTDANGGYVWSVMVSNDTDTLSNKTYTTEHLNFKANQVGKYTIQLKSNQFDLQTEQILNITRPTILNFNKLYLEKIPQSYSAMYFKILKGTENSTTSYVYTSETKQSINSLTPNSTVWDINDDIKTIEITDNINEDYLSYSIEFYDANDNLMTRLDPFSNYYEDNAQFIAEERKLKTTTICGEGCVNFEVMIDFSFQ